MGLIEARDAFFEPLVDNAIADKNVILLAADHHAFSLNRLEQEAPTQFINVGISEQNMISVSAGLAYAGKIVFAYGITPFVSLKILEQLALDVAAPNVNVNIVSVGVGFSYSTDGPSHHGIQDLGPILSVPGLTVLNASDPTTSGLFADAACNSSGPSYLRIEKGLLAELPHTDEGLSSGVSCLKRGKDGYIVATGAIVHECLVAAQQLQDSRGLDLGVIDLFKLKPLPGQDLLFLLKNSSNIFTVEEGLLSGGMGSHVATLLMEAGLNSRFLRIGIDDQFCFEYGSRPTLLSRMGLDAAGINAKIINFLDRN